MARYQPAPDLWDAATRAALDDGSLVLQPGQWVRLGDMSSRFYRHNAKTGHVVAFHGRRATRDMVTYARATTQAKGF